MAKQTTPIRISIETKEQLNKIGHTSDTYDTVIQKLIEHYKKKCKKKSQ